MKRQPGEVIDACHVSWLLEVRAKYRILHFKLESLMFVWLTRLDSLADISSRSRGFRGGFKREIMRPDSITRVFS